MKVVDAVASMASSLTIGDPLEPETDIGPMVSSNHRQKVEDYIAIGKSEGARLVAGGKRPAGIDAGWFIEPTVFADVNNNQRIAREEIFGPILAIIKYDNEEDAINIVNDSQYGLGGTVWASNADRALQLARKLNTGTVGINGYMPDLNAPFGGVKDSGFGRELGPEGLSAFQVSQSIYLLSA